MKLRRTLDTPSASRNLPLAMLRTLQPELLDALPPDDPAALHSRRDLRLVNLAMGNFRWFARTLPPLVRPGERILELGAGTGELARVLHARGLAADALDRCPAPADWPAARVWHRADLTAFPAYAEYSVILGNLIFHHFSAPELADLGNRLRSTARLIVACEPARHRIFQLLIAVVAPLLGANHVTRHDARVSIAAGFRADELPRALGLDPAAWDCRVTTSPLGGYRLVALRRA